MKTTLIIHPDDPSTTFLKGIYSNLKDKTIIKGGITKYKLQEKIDTHARVILCGHGSPNGLLSVGQFPDAYPYIIDDSMVSLLRTKANTIYIWCNADQFCSPPWAHRFAYRNVSQSDVRVFTLWSRMYGGRYN